MQAATVSRLLDLNHLFYQTFGQAFSATRQRIQSGVRLLLPRLPVQGRWLDLGCGNGELAREMAATGFLGEYVGLDFSEELIEIANETHPHPRPLSLGGRGEEEGRGEQERRGQFRFVHGDLADPQWAAGFEMASFDCVVAFAVLHHLPGVELRLKILRQARLLLKEDGLLVHSVWQFQHSPRLMARVQPWVRAGLTAADVEEGDTLLDWRAAMPGQPEQSGLRYVHLFSPAELAHLAEFCGFEVVDTFASDGQGGRLGLYQVWRPV